jgi:hypothetical protein
MYGEERVQFPLVPFLAGGERGIRTLDGDFSPYSLSRGAPSATRPSLQNFGKNKGLQKQLVAVLVTSINLKQRCLFLTIPHLPQDQSRHVVLV